MNTGESIFACMVTLVIGGLLFSLGYAIHLNAKREDDVVTACAHTSRPVADCLLLRAKR